MVHGKLCAHACLHTDTYMYTHVPHITDAGIFLRWSHAWIDVGSYCGVLKPASNQLGLCYLNTNTLEQLVTVDQWSTYDGSGFR